MRTLMRWAAVVIVVHVVAAHTLYAQTTGASRPAREPLVDSVRVAWLDYGRRMNARDFDGALTYYADDPRFLWIDRGAVVARSHADMAKGFAKFPEMGPMKFMYEPAEIVVLGRDAALMTVTFRIEMGGPPPAAFGGIMTLTWIRTSSGWKILVGHA